MEDHDGRIARDRCLGRMVECEDLETRVSLWRAALRYNAKGAATAGENSGRRVTSVTGVGLLGGREG